VPDSEFDVALPAPVLRPFVSHYAGFAAHGLTPGSHAALPSRHAHLIISLGAPFDVLRMPNTTQRPASFRAIVNGLQDGPATVALGTNVEGLHVFLTPIGVRPVLGVSGADVGSRVFDLSDLWGADSGRLIDRLREAATWPARFAILDDVFARSLGPADTHPTLVWAWRQILISGGRRSMEGLAREIGWSRPHFTERFRSELGLTPKVAARIVRFERACWMIKNARPRLADVAAACGYHDQAHMTREWHALAGCSPRAWIARELPFLQDYELAGSDDRVHDLPPGASR
jgi:AraC-like DNA-binding protein